MSERYSLSSSLWWLVDYSVGVAAITVGTLIQQAVITPLRSKLRTSRSKSATTTARLATMADTLSPWKEDESMMLPPGGKPTMGVPFKTPEQIEAERDSYKHVTAWLRWRQQRRFVGRDNDAHLVTVWASSIGEIYQKYGENIHGVYAADDGKYQYTHFDWAVLLEEAWDSGQVGVDNSESPWYNLLNGQKGSNEK